MHGSFLFKPLLLLPSATLATPDLSMQFYGPNMKPFYAEPWPVGTSPSISGSPKLNRDVVPQRRFQTFRSAKYMGSLGILYRPSHTVVRYFETLALPQAVWAAHHSFQRIGEFR